MKYRQLTEKDRYQIELMIALKKRVIEIAERLKVHRSTVYREVKRNSLETTHDGVVYDAVPAQALSEERRRDGAQCRRKVRAGLAVFVKAKLQEDLSPEQIAAISKTRISYSSIYRFIAYDREDFFSQGLYKHLRRYILKRQRRVRRTAKAVEYTGAKRSIRERPRTCESRSEAGHFERDLMEGRRGSKALLVIVDRKTRFLKLALVERKHDDVHRATKKIIRKLKPKSITNDNGIEFVRSRLREQEKELRTKVYFCDPFAPWQRGTVENTIGLIRQYLPKRLDLAGVTAQQLREIETKLNHRPRKALNFKTPFEMQNAVAKSA